VDDDGGQRRNADFDTIQEAVDAAAPGDTIRVFPGLYDEQVVFDATKDRIKLESVSKHRAVIAPTGQDGENSAYVRVDGAEGVVIDGFTIAGPSNLLEVGVLVHEGGSATIRDNRITDIRRDPLDGVQSVFAIQIGGIAEDGSETTGRATITGNAITRYQKVGVAVITADSFADISRNTIAGVGPTDQIAQYGVVVGFGADAAVTRNDIRGNVYTPDGTESAGVYVLDAGRVTVTGNDLDRNEIGVLVEDQTGPLYVGFNDVDDSTLDGIRLTGTDGAVVVGNRVEDSGRDGIRLEDVTDAVVSLNRVSENERYGLAVVGDSKDNLIVLNDLRRNGTFDAFDDTTGAGTAGTANRWLLNRIGTASPAGLR
jgi:parallel beta-helix repeat protein